MKDDEKRHSRRNCRGPVDLDNMDDHSVLSEISVGDVTETSVSDETPEEENRLGALAATMSAKQQNISWAFASMVSKMASTIEEMENANEELLGHDSTDGREKRREKSEQCCKAVNAMAKKQTRMSKQIDKVVEQLIERNRQKDLEKIQLKNQIAQLKAKMKEMQATMDKSVSDSQKPKKSTGGIVPRKTPHIKGSGSTRTMETFSIREISFCNMVVDVTEVSENVENLSISEREHTAAENVRFLL